MIAEKLTQERSRDYMNARRVAKVHIHLHHLHFYLHLHHLLHLHLHLQEYEAVTRGLNKMTPSIPPTGSQEELKQVLVVVEVVVVGVVVVEVVLVV